jgi:hypothetical protein
MISAIIVAFHLDARLWSAATCRRFAPGVVAGEIDKTPGRDPARGKLPQAAALHLITPDAS